MRLNFKILAVFFGGLVLIVSMCFGDVIWPNTAWVFSDSSKDESVAGAENDTETFCLAIDPGHGGFDGGAVGKDGTCEKDINLAIALELKEILKDYPVSVTMIREDDVALGENKQQDLKARETIIEDERPDLTVSIHLNSYPSDVSVYGAQVFYPSKEQKRTAEDSCEQSSKTYAENVQEALETNIDDGRTRSAMAKGDTYLFRNLDTPYILIECGFLSNIEECDMLKKAEYQRLLAESIWKGINTSLKLEKKQKIQIIQSANKQ